jgi:hypothetical protein
LPGTPVQESPAIGGTGTRGDDDGAFRTVYVPHGIKINFITYIRRRNQNQLTEKRMGCIGMKGYAFIVCFILVLLMAAVPVSATSTTSTSTLAAEFGSITTVSPSVAETSDTVTVTLTGVNFTNTAGSVWLEKSGESNIVATVNSWTYNTIKCSITTKSSTEPGKWNVVVGKDGDKTTIVKSSGFAVTKPVTITSLTPETGQIDDDVDFTIAGKEFDEDTIKEVFLTQDDYKNNITSDYSVDTSTKIKGDFDLSDADEGTYHLCIEDIYGGVVCKKKVFKITSNAEGTIDIASSPSGATIYIDDITNGTTPRSVNILVGSHKIILKKTGYQDWGKTVNVEEDDTVEVDATLYAAATATPTTQPTAVPTTARTATPRTTVKSTMKIPTTYAEPVTTAAASPVDPVLIISAICLAFIALRKH